MIRKEHHEKFERSTLRRVSLKLLAEALMVLMLAHSQLSGQSIYGTIEGTITDPSGAVVPGAKIEVKNAAG